MAEILNYFGVGGIAFVFICVFVEITPIQFNPLQWLGNRFNAGLKADIARMEIKSDRMGAKLDEHIAKDLRDSILSFEKNLRNGTIYDDEDWDNVIKDCDDYENFIEKNKLKNGRATKAITNIRNKYQEM